MKMLEEDPAGVVVADVVVDCSGRRCRLTLMLIVPINVVGSEWSCWKIIRMKFLEGTLLLDRDRKGRRCWMGR